VSGAVVPWLRRLVYIELSFTEASQVYDQLRVLGRAMVQAVSHQRLTAEAQVSPCGICGRQSGTGAGFSPSTSVFPYQFHSTGAPLQGKTKKKLIIFITGLHNTPQGCGASVASAAGPLTKKRKGSGTPLISDGFKGLCCIQSA
jgi:hypothetical protein